MLPTVKFLVFVRAIFCEINNGFLKCSSFPYNYLLEVDKVFLYAMFKSKDDFSGNIGDFVVCLLNDQPAAGMSRLCSTW